jgi:hypothetical protein
LDSFIYQSCAQRIWCLSGLLRLPCAFADANLCVVQQQMTVAAAVFISFHFIFMQPAVLLLSMLNACMQPAVLLLSMLNACCCLK